MAQATNSLSPILDILVTPEPSIHDYPMFNHPALISGLARSSARKVVEERLRSEGVRVSTTPIRIIMEEANEYLKAHPELVAQAIETVRKVPQLRTLAEGEARDRARKRKQEVKRR